ncbi:hypothetical protein MUN81_10310 [Hymenobacter sp. 5317J-9]|uniref:hypothetical protein n=1 Tax=Hymenobacter sp. 5317J-9 TaxID=2932250 RepID=UPI001FD721B3|nr:hypothetical protein [Hymenobacter sp. 5317J-9]UOQ99871.1 hypothetical protein MUN81_10310 [Hymenobacter sp. 5317J-9]
MPKTSTIPPVLKALLKYFKTNLTEMSQKTGISRERLIHLCLTGDFTQAELRRLADCLRPEFARSFIGISQVGNFNIAGNGNRQQTTIINNITHVTNNTVVVIQVLPTVEEPEPKALGGSSQRWEQQVVQPGGYVRQPMQPCSVVRQLRQPNEVRELGQAA